MAAQILAGSVAVGVVPSAVGFAEKLRAAIVPESAKVGEQAAQVITDAIRAKLEEFKGSVSVEANTGPATASIDRLRAETEKPAVMPVKVETTGGGGKAALGSKEALAAEGAAGGEALAGGFSKKTKEGFNKVGKDAAKGIAGIAIGSIYEGIKLQHSADVLTAAEKTKGIAIAANKPLIDAQAKAMQQYGVSYEQVNAGLTQLINTGTPMSVALRTQATAARVAAATGKDYTTVLASFVKGGGTAARMIKQLGVSQITGKDQATALGAASTFLANRIQQVGGIAKFAASQHISLGQAQKLATEAAGASVAAQDALASKGLTLTSATNLLTAAHDGNATALKKLNTVGLTQSQLQGLVTKGASGNIAAYNKLGIEVMPKTNTMTENLNQSTKILSNMYGKEASAATESFGMKVKAIRAELANVSGTIGLKVLPDLTKLMKLFANPDVLIAALAITGVVAAIWIFVKAVEFAKKAQQAFGVVTKGISKIISGDVVPAIAKQEAGTATLNATIAEQEVQIGALNAALAEQSGATEAAAGATTELDVAMDANPIGIIILAIVGLVAGLVLLYTHVKIVREIFKAAFKDIKAIVVDVFDWIRDHWKLLLAILGGPVGLAVALIASHFKDIEAVVKKTFDWISTNWAKIYDAISGPFIKAFDFVKKAFTKFYDDVIKPVIGTIGKVLSWLGLGSTKGVQGPGGGGGGTTGTSGAPPVLAAPKQTAAQAKAAAASTWTLDSFKPTAAPAAAVVATAAEKKAAAAAVAAASQAAHLSNATTSVANTTANATASKSLSAQEAAALVKAVAGDAKGTTAATKATQQDTIRIEYQKKIDAAKMAALVQRNNLRLALLQKEEQLYPAKAAQYAAQIAAFKKQDAMQVSAMSKQNAIALAALRGKTTPAAIAAAATAAGGTSTQNWLSGPLGRASIAQTGSANYLSGVPTLGSVTGATSSMSSLSGGSTMIPSAAPATSSTSGASAQSAFEKAVITRLGDIVAATDRVGADVGRAFNGQGRTSATRAAHMTRVGG
jgi:hypothetical protein